MQKLLLRPQFIDRGGKTVYNIHLDSGKGALIGQIRFTIHDNESRYADLEWEQNKVHVRAESEADKADPE